MHSADLVSLDTEASSNREKALARMNAAQGQGLFPFVKEEPTIWQVNNLAYSVVAALLCSPHSSVHQSKMVKCFSLTGKI